jgi:DNA-binding LytR/AlgR family response regulator
MKLAIIEDEIYAYKELKRMLENLYPDAVIVAHYDSVKSAIKGIPSIDVDLIFFDISLQDGFSFEILNALNIQTPIIFTTAYEEHSLKAFKFNSIDYLLKPIDEEDLREAVEKYISLKNQYQSSDIDLSFNKNKTYKNRFLVKVGDTYSYVKTEDIAYFYSEDKTTFIQTFNNHSYITDQSLNDLEELVNPIQFFRITRHIICSINAVVSSSKYFNSRLLLSLKPQFNGEVLISRVRVKSFLEWLDQ